MGRKSKLRRLGPKKGNRSQGPGKHTVKGGEKKSREASGNAESGAEKKEGGQEPAAQAQQPAAKSLYRAGDMILLVGEGDLSFSCALARKLGGSAFLQATTFDDARSLRKKYPSDAPENMRLLKSGFGNCALQHGIDATRLHEDAEYHDTFSKIVFNFPHCGGDAAESDADSLAEHQQLLSEFFASAMPCLDADPAAQAEIHVTLRAGPTYEAWRIQSLAKNAVAQATEDGDDSVAAARKLRCDRVVPFCKDDYPGYKHRRTKGQQYELARGLKEDNVYLGAKTYVFTLKKGA